MAKSVTRVPPKKLKKFLGPAPCCFIFRVTNKKTVQKVVTTHLASKKTIILQDHTTHIHREEI